jgi:uncharacterized protein YprB with RNaseH-like and TPR domain
LKGCERQLGLDRGDLRDIDGFFAVLLWDEFVKTENLQTLETLLAYNVQDTISLENLMVTAYNLKIKETPFYKDLLIEASRPPANPFRADLATKDRITNKFIIV